MNLLEIRNDVFNDIKIMTLFNNPMMRAVFSHKECVNEVIDIILGRYVHIDDHHVEHYMSNIKGREARFDIYVKSEKIRINVEIQRDDNGAHPKRGRLNLSLIDTQEIKKSSKYEEAPESYMIFICERDYFKKGLPMYHLKLTNRETNEEVNVGQEIIYVSGDYQDRETALGRLIHDFHCVDPSDMYSQSIKKWFRYYKQDKGGVKKMCEITRKWMGIGYEEGILVGKEEGYTNGKSDGKIELTMSLLLKKLGTLPECIIKKVNNSDEKELEQLSLNIFDIENEEDILKYIH